MQNSFFEVAHCGVDVSKPRLFTVIVGTKGDNPQFFCHVFKCESKESASKTTRAVAAGATEVYRRAMQLAAEENTRQRKRNQSAGYGMVTNDEAEAERKANAKGKHGAITNAEVVAVPGAAPSADTLAYLLRYLDEGKLVAAAAFVDNKKANWAEALQAQLNAALAKAGTKAGTIKAVAEHIQPVVQLIQKAYTEANLATLAKKEMAGTLNTLAMQFDVKVSTMLLQFAIKYIEKLGSDGAEAIRLRVQELDDGSDDVQLYNATDSKLKKEKGDAAYRETGAAFAAALKEQFRVPPPQPFTTILENMVFSLAGEQTFKAAVNKIGEGTGAEVKLSDRKGSSLKGFLRLYEKALLKAVILKLKIVDFSKIFDVLRAMLVAKSTAVAAKAQKAVYTSEALQPCRSKCRLVGTSVTGWRDELINVKHAVGEYGLIGEIQIVRSKMLLQRETMGGHDGYDDARSLRGLYEACTAIVSSPASTTAAKELTKKEQKALAEIQAERKKVIAIRDKAIASFDASMAKLALKEEAITGKV